MPGLKAAGRGYASTRSSPANVSPKANPLSPLGERGKAWPRDQQSHFTDGILRPKLAPPQNFFKQNLRAVVYCSRRED